MAQGSQDFEDPDYEDYLRGVMPAAMEDRASTSLRSPEFQKSENPEKQKAEMEQAAAPTVVGRLPDAKEPVIVHQRQRERADDAAGYQAEQRLGQEERRAQERIRRQTAREINTGDVYTGTDGRAKRRQADDVTGDITESDVLGSGAYRTDQTTGEQYVTGRDGVRMMVGMDETLAERAKLGEERKRLTLEQRMESAAMAETRAQMEPVKEQVKAFGQAPDALTAQIGRLKAGMDPAKPNPAAATQLAAMEKRLADWHQANPGYAAVKGQLDTFTTDLTTREERKRAREKRILQTMTTPEMARRMAVSPDTVTVQDRLPKMDAHGDLDAKSVEGFARGLAERRNLENARHQTPDGKPAGGGTTPTLAHLLALHVLRGKGARTVGGQPIGQVIETLTPKRPRAQSELIASKEFQALPYAARLDALFKQVDAEARFLKQTDPAFDETAFRGKVVDRPGALGFLKELWAGLGDALVNRFPADLAGIWRNGDISTLKPASWVDKLVENRKAESGKQKDSLQYLAGSQTAKGAKEGPASVFSSIAVGIPAFLAGAKAGGVIGAAATPELGGVGAVPGAAIGGIVGSAAGTGAAFYRLGQDQFIGQLRDKFAADHPAATDAEWNAFRTSPAVVEAGRKYGLIEGGVEAGSSALTAGIFHGGGKLLRVLAPEVIDKIAAKSVATATRRGARIMAKVAAEQGQEVGTETLQQKWESDIEAAFQLRARGQTYGEALADVAAPTLVGGGLQAGVQMGLAKALGKSGDRKAESGKTDSDGGTATNPADVGPVAPVDNFTPLAAKLNETQAKIRTARDAGDLAGAQVLADDAVEVQRDLHETSLAELGKVPVAMRKTFAQVGDANADFEGNEQALQDDPNLHFAAAAIGDAFGNPNTSITSSKVDAGVSSFITKQHAGLAALRDVAGLLSGKALPAERAAVLESLGLVQTETDATTGAMALRVTDDAVALLPHGVRERIKAAGTALPIVVTPGETGDFLANLVKTGVALRGKAESGKAETLKSAGAKKSPDARGGGAVVSGDAGRTATNSTTTNAAGGNAPGTAGGVLSAESGERAGQLPGVGAPDERRGAAQPGSDVSGRQSALAGAGVVIADTDGDTLADAADDGTLTLRWNAAQAAKEGDGGVRLLNHEALHLGAMFASRKRWEADGARGSFKEWFHDEGRDTFNDLRSRYAALPDGSEKTAIGRAIVAAFNVYAEDYNLDAPRMTEPQAVLDALAGKGVKLAWAQDARLHGSNFAFELARMMSEMRAAGQIHESTFTDFLARLKAWMSEALTALRELAVLGRRTGNEFYRSQLMDVVREQEAEFDAIFDHETITDRNRRGSGRTDSPAGAADRSNPAGDEAAAKGPAGSGVEPPAKGASETPAKADVAGGIRDAETVKKFKVAPVKAGANDTPLAEVRQELATRGIPLDAEVPEGIARALVMQPNYVVEGWASENLGKAEIGKAETLKAEPENIARTPVRAPGGAAALPQTDEERAAARKAKRKAINKQVRAETRQAAEDADLSEEERARREAEEGAMAEAMEAQGFVPLATAVMRFGGLPAPKSALWKEYGEEIGRVFDALRLRNKAQRSSTTHIKTGKLFRAGAGSSDELAERLGFESHNDLFAALETELATGKPEWINPEQEAERATGMASDEQYAGMMARTQDGRAVRITPPGVIELRARTAHHGTPHTIEDRFSTEKIGTGEGAQVYGWGLYFAENEAVAKSYRNAGRSDLKRFEVSERARRRFQELYPSGTASVGQLHGLTAESLATFVRGNTGLAQEVRAALPPDLVQELETSPEIGNTYTVELDVEPEDLLDWDKPLSEQSEKVRAAINRLFPLKGPENITGELAYRHIAGIEAHYGVSQKQAPIEASKRLTSVGIPGIQFLDQGSRLPAQTASYLTYSNDGDGRTTVYDTRHGTTLGRFDNAKQAEKFLADYKEKAKSNQTYNYVIFDDSKIRITHRNGEPVGALRARRDSGTEDMFGESGDRRAESGKIEPTVDQEAVWRRLTAKLLAGEKLSPKEIENYAAAEDALGQGRLDVLEHTAMTAEQRAAREKLAQRSEIARRRSERLIGGQIEIADDMFGAKPVDKSGNGMLFARRADARDEEIAEELTAWERAGSEQSFPVAPRMETFLNQSGPKAGGTLKTAWDQFKEAKSTADADFDAWVSRQGRMGVFVGKPEVIQWSGNTVETASVVTPMNGGEGWRATIFKRTTGPNVTDEMWAGNQWEPWGHSEHKTKIEAYGDARAAVREARFSNFALFARRDTGTADLFGGGSPFNLTAETPGGSLSKNSKPSNTSNDLPDLFNLERDRGRAGTGDAGGAGGVSAGPGGTGGDGGLLDEAGGGGGDTSRGGPLSADVPSGPVGEPGDRAIRGGTPGTAERPAGDAGSAGGGVADDGGVSPEPARPEQAGFGFIIPGSSVETVAAGGDAGESGKRKAESGNLGDSPHPLADLRPGEAIEYLDNGKWYPTKARGNSAGNAFVSGTRLGPMVLTTLPAPRDVMGANVVRRAEKSGEVTPISGEPPSKTGEGFHPSLTPEQRGDVVFIEKRLASKPGVLITNGTGTGKTFTGLGAVHRMLEKGAKHILVVAPSDKIGSDWVATAKQFFGIADIGQLTSTKDNGEGNRIVVATYANLGQNRALVARPWDAIVADEAHYLSQAADGKPTQALHSFRALTWHEDGTYRRAQMLETETWARQEEIERRKELEEELIPQAIEALKKKPKADEDAAKVAEKRRKIGVQLAAYRVEMIELRPGSKEEERALHETVRRREEAVKAERKGFTEATRPKALLMSATPFAYHFSLDYAEGYLFDHGPEPTSGAYNTPSARGQFYMENFGYRMRYGKLTTPENAVATGILERRFAEKLMREGAMSGRALQVPHDYSRDFVLSETALGAKIDEIMDTALRSDELRPLLKHMGVGDYLSRRFLLESLKAREAITRIRKHLALGRKVVVFHDYKKGGGTNPLRLTSRGATETRWTPEGVQNVDIDALYAQLRAEVPGFDEAVAALDRLRSPIEAFTAEFREAGIFNGSVPKERRKAIVDEFNKSGGPMKVILVQRASGKEGISLHDRDGKHQRVFIDLGIPGRPTDAIQSEGRIYRHGVQSDAVMEYLITGTNFERWTFAQTIAQRASTAENLAMGERARALLQSFASGFNDAAVMEPGAQQGTGGKARDAAVEHGDPFDNAVALYYTNQKKTSRNKSAEGIDYFPTPEPLGFKMVEWANIEPGEKVLEPSAGHGAIARFFPDSTTRHAVEPSNELAGRLALNATDTTIHQQRFEDFNIVNKFNAVVMNPPFGTAGRTAVDHVMKAAGHLRDGGRIVALIPEGSATAKFEQWLYGEEESAKGMYLVADIGLPAVTFERAGTGVKARVVILDKALTEEGRVQVGGRSRGRTDIAGEDIKEFFENLKHRTVPERVRVAGAVVEQEEETPPADALKSPSSIAAENAISLAEAVRRAEAVLGEGHEPARRVLEAIADLPWRGVDDLFKHPAIKRLAATPKQREALFIKTINELPDNALTRGWTRTPPIRLRYALPGTTQPGGIMDRRERFEINVREGKPIVASWPEKLGVPVPEGYVRSADGKTYVKGEATAPGGAAALPQSIPPVSQWTRDTILPVQPKTEADKVPVPARASDFSPADFLHTKTGQPVYVATIERRLEREEFTAVRARATAGGGYYSSFKGAGAIPGFHFKTAEARDAFLGTGAQLRARRDFGKAEIGKAESGNISALPRVRGVAVTRGGRMRVRDLEANQRNLADALVRERVLLRVLQCLEVAA